MLDVETASRADLIAHIDTLEAKLNAYGEDRRQQRIGNLAHICQLERQPARIAAVLADGRVHSTYAILDHLYADRPDDAPGSQVVSVSISKLRPVLARYGVAIETRYGVGYQIGPGLSTLQAIADGMVITPDCEIGQEIMERWRCGRQRRVQLLDALRQRQALAGDQPFDVRARDLAKPDVSATAVSNAIRSFEQRGFVTVLNAPLVGGRRSQPWRLRLTDKGMSL